MSQGFNKGPYFKAFNALAFDQQALRLRGRLGWEGFGLYVGLMCASLNQDGARLDVSDADGWTTLALQLGCDEGTLRELVSFLAERGMADAGALADGALVLPPAAEGLATCERLSAAGRKAGQASGRRRRGE